MNKRKVVLFFAALAMLLVGIYQYKRYRVAPELPVENLTLIDSGGNSLQLNDIITGKSIISFYASWCGDCIRELNSMQKCDNGILKNVQVILITDESDEKLKAFIKKRNYSYLFFRMEKNFSSIGINSIPVTYVLDKNRTVIYNKVGAINWTDSSFTSHLMKIWE